MVLHTRTTISASSSLTPCSATCSMFQSIQRNCIGRPRVHFIRPRRNLRDFGPSFPSAANKARSPGAINSSRLRRFFFPPAPYSVSGCALSMRTAYQLLGLAVRGRLALGRLPASPHFGDNGLALSPTNSSSNSLVASRSSAVVISQYGLDRFLLFIFVSLATALFPLVGGSRCHSKSGRLFRAALNEDGYANPFASLLLNRSSGSTPTDSRIRPSVMPWRCFSAGLT